MSVSVCERVALGLLKELWLEQLSSTIPVAGTPDGLSYPGSTSEAGTPEGHFTWACLIRRHSLCDSHSGQLVSAAAFRHSFTAKRILLRLRWEQALEIRTPPGAA